MAIDSAAFYVKHHLQNFQYCFGYNNFFTLNLDTLIVSLVLGLIFLMLFYTIAKKATSDAPNNLQNFFEMIIEFIDENISHCYGDNKKFIAPLAINLFIWILLMNFMDLIPVDFMSIIIKLCGFDNNLINFKIVPTTDPNLTFALSISIFLLILFFNLKYKKFFGFTKEILTQPFGMKLFPLNIFFRLLDEIIKPLSLSLRLYGNLFAGELIFILIALLPWYIQWIFGSLWAIFHILIIFIQAFVFMMLSVIYIKMACEKH